MKRLTVLHHFFDVSIGIPYNIYRPKVVKNGIGLTGTVLYNARALIDGEAEGGETVGNGDVAHRLVHQFRAVGILIIERSCWLRGIGQRVVTQIGIGPVRFVRIRGFFVSRNNVIAELGRSIRNTKQPRILIVIDMEDNEATARKRTVPPCFLSVLNHVILVRMAIIVDDIGFVGRHITNRLRHSKWLGGNPSHHHTLMTRIVAWTEAIVIIASIHQIPIMRCLVSTIEVGETKAMRVLMAKDTKGTIVAVALFRNSTVAVHSILLLAIGDGNGVAIDIRLVGGLVIILPM